MLCPVKRTLPGRMRGCSPPTPTCQPCRGTKLTLPLIPHPVLSETQQDSNKASVSNHLPRYIGSINCGALCGSSRSKNPPQDWGQHPPVPSAWQGHSLCKAGTQVRAVNNAIILLQLAPQHLLLSFLSPVYSAASSKGVAWTGRTPQPPSVLCSSTDMCFI